MRTNPTCQSVYQHMRILFVGAMLYLVTLDLSVWLIPRLQDRTPQCHGQFTSLFLWGSSLAMGLQTGELSRGDHHRIWLCHPWDPMQAHPDNLGSHNHLSTGIGFTSLLRPRQKLDHLHAVHQSYIHTYLCVYAKTYIHMRTCRKCMCTYPQMCTYVDVLM